MKSTEEQLESVLSQRKTSKVLAEKPWEATLDRGAQQQLITELLSLGATAPVHYKSAERHHSDDLPSSLPFRAYTMRSDECRKLADMLEALDPPAGKIINMLWAAEAVIVTTWLPDVFGDQPEERMAEPVPFTGNLRNMEHLAATGAAIQNMLLGATAKGFPSYWSSGGVIRHKEVREILSVSLEEILLGVLFLFPKDAEERGVEVKPGKLRSSGKSVESWSKSVTF